MPFKANTLTASQTIKNIEYITTQDRTTYMYMHIHAEIGSYMYNVSHTRAVYMYMYMCMY